MSTAELIHSEEFTGGFHPAASLPVASKVSNLPLPTRIAFVGNSAAPSAASPPLQPTCALPRERIRTRSACLPFPSTIRILVTSTRNRYVSNLHQEEIASYERAADFLNFNGNDLVCLQHEYGIYGGRGQPYPHLAAPAEDAACDHAAHRAARTGRRSASVLEEIAQLSDRLVVMSELAAQIASRSLFGPGRQNRCHPPWCARSALHGSELFQGSLRHGGQVRTAHVRPAVAEQGYRECDSGAAGDSRQASERRLPRLWRYPPPYPAAGRRALPRKLVALAEHLGVSSQDLQQSLCQR